jgi:hypothetical protein
VGIGPVNVRIDVDGGGYQSACDAFYDANHGVIDVVSTLSSAVGGLGGMAGTDTGGEAWAAQYDPAATQAVQAGCDLGQSLSTLANLLNGTLVNHDAADGGAMLSGPPELTGQSTGDHDPDHWTEELTAAAPPSAKGGTGDQPGWWHWIAGHVEGLLWPDADTGKLRSAGSAWITAGDNVDGYKYDAQAASAMVASQTSPEVPDAVSACDEISGHIGDLAEAYREIGKACNDYAQAVDDHHKEVEDELKSFIEWTIAIEAGGAVLGFFTLGLGEGAAQAAEAAEVANAASKVVRILKNLIEIARTVATTIGRALTRIGEIAGKLGKFLNAKIERALVKLGVKEAEADGLLWTSWANYPKVTVNGREYAKIGDRLYSHHAVDRLQPSGLGAPAGATGAGRSVPPSVIDDILSTVKGTRVTGPHGEVRFSFVSGSVQVITEDDIVITVITR